MQRNMQGTIRTFLIIIPLKSRSKIWHYNIFVKHDGICRIAVIYVHLDNLSIDHDIYRDRMFLIAAIKFKYHWSIVAVFYLDKFRINLKVMYLIVSNLILNYLYHLVVNKYDHNKNVSCLFVMFLDVLYSGIDILVTSSLF